VNEHEQRAMERARACAEKILRLNIHSKLSASWIQQEVFAVIQDEHAEVARRLRDIANDGTKLIDVLGTRGAVRSLADDLVNE